MASSDFERLQLLPLPLRLDPSNAHQLRLEDEHRVRRNRAHPSAAVTPLWLDRQPSLLADTHVQKALVPALDHLAFADVEGERGAAIVGGIELGACEQVLEGWRMVGWEGDWYRLPRGCRGSGLLLCRL